MKLNQLYSLRNNYTIIGLTGRVGSGCSEIASILSHMSSPELDRTGFNSNKPDHLKAKICEDFLRYPENWKNYKIIKYKDIIFLHLLYECAISSSDYQNWKEKIWDVITQNGPSQNNTYTNRFDRSDDAACKSQLFELFDFKREEIFGILFEYLQFKSASSLNDFLIDKISAQAYQNLFDLLETAASFFYDLLNKYSVTKRTRLIHDLANNLRGGGCIHNFEKENIDRIYTVAITINRLIKLYKRHNIITKIVIDSLKNSLELMFFKEKYSAFYMVAITKWEDERKMKVKSALGGYSDYGKHVKHILSLDNEEYKVNDFVSGVFSSPDIENCIQKSDYHIFNSLESDDGNDEFLKRNHLQIQIIKLAALIHQPGIITPTNIERCMQIAFVAKSNSGCISRQVGAVITDENFSVKAIGWNDVAQHQMPCNLRSINDLIDNKNNSHFSEYERTGGTFTKEKRRFVDLLTENNNTLSTKKDDLKGRNCSFCFKSYQNTFEGEKNQVHTRSLHAEENAMLQIAKNGGTSIQKGNLFTTASPCELCSKKAFQLGIKNIYYIDPYPGISSTHILKGGVERDKNPNLIMFKGAVGRTYHKLYDPFIAYKDEIAILTGIKPHTPKEFHVKELRNALDEELKNNESLRKKLDERLRKKEDIVKEILHLLEKGIDIEMTENKKGTH